MQLIINGAKREFKSDIPNGIPQKITLRQVLQELKVNPATIAVELNRMIIPKGKFENTILKEGDKLEIISFVGGG